MKTLFEPSTKTPGVYIDEDKHLILIEGRFIPENPQEFFADFSRVVEKIYTQYDKMCLKFDLEYFNTGAARGLYKFFIHLQNKKNISITWVYEEDDEDIFESGKEFENLTGLNFNYETK
ncbi:MAG: SiaC family regulatory phosphoprotein [Bacteroidales bacterium]|nr:SiaC family regulatory phosphoprotein [Bacteroidales bacterium]MDD4216014.1 SiaC family regulatory phosphoprotein [Bacteroidales bacterium]MDY0140295.1 SiaC family regulatory phosphoprotein [Bacteroidales bacterium]